jgi:hypothetical protein
MRRFRLADDTDLAQLFLGSELPTVPRIVRHLRSTAKLLPPTITPEILANFLLSEFQMARSKRNEDDHMVSTILFLAANPQEKLLRDLELELRSLEQELSAVKYRDSIRLVAKHAVQPDDLIRYVRAESPKVIHFSGHGSARGIVLRGDNGENRVVEGQSLARFLEGRGVELVVLASCFSKSQADNIGKVVKAVVGTTDVVKDEAARRFTAAFYRTFGNGLSVKEAFRDGTDAVDLYSLPGVFHSSGDLEGVLVADPRC